MAARTPDQYVAAITRAQAKVDKAVEQADTARTERDRLIGELRRMHGWSYARIVEAVGLSTPRVQQILERNGLA
jgi:DNA-directed RNA polymerase specialized sigma24 family protein